MNDKISKVGLIYAMFSEARPLIETLSLEPHHKLNDPFKMQTWIGNRNGVEIIAMTPGKSETYGCPNIGVLPASLAAYNLINQFEPDIVINAGTAGGFVGRKVSVGEVYLCSGSVSFYDRRLPLALFEGYGRGSYALPKVDSIANAVGLKLATLVTGSSFNCSSLDLREIKKAKADLKDMEAAAVAWICDTSRIPLYILKVVTDIVAENIAEGAAEFTANYRQAAVTLNEKVVEVVDYLSEKSVVSS